MANYCIPGPICGECQQWAIDDGTLSLTQSPLPGPNCSYYPEKIIFSLQTPAIEPDLNFLFQQCNNPATGLSEENYKEAAKILDVDIETVKAVAEVETSGKAFDDSGHPRILFERHYFNRLTSGKFDAGHQNISNPSPGGYGKFSAQYGRLEEAYQLDLDAALRSASWGRFQIMGENFRAAGFSTVKEFVLAMAKSESEHLKAFVNFVGSNKSMLASLRKKDWAGFAAAYNGPSYKRNNYDKKLKDTYDRLKQPEDKTVRRKP